MRYVSCYQNTIKHLLSLSFLSVVLAGCYNSTELTGTLGSTSPCSMTSMLNEKSVRFNAVTGDGRLNIGVNGHVMLGNTITNLTMSSWAKAPSSSATVILTSMYNILSPGGLIFMLSNGQPNFYYLNGGSYNPTAPVQVINQWHFYVLVYNAGHTVVYVDGVSVLDDSTLPTSLDLTIASGANVFLSNLPAAFISWEAYQDEAAIWSNSLSSEEVLALYNNGQPTDLTVNECDYQSASNLVAWWRMGDGATAPTIPDDSPNGFDGTLMGDYSISTDAP